jgi:CDP-glucose 4,6-dehydratase
MEDLERLNFWKDKKVFVTGSTGVIGLNIVNRLAGCRADVVALVRDSVPGTRNLGEWLDGRVPNVTVVKGELEDYSFLMRVLAEYEIEYIFHLGAQTIVHAGNRSPATTFRANIEGTWNLLEAARVLESYSREINAICVASSDKAYGSSKKLPYTEDMPLKGEHPYDVSKSCTDLIARSYAATYRLPICVARMGNIYGYGDLNFNRVIPGTIRSILRNQPVGIRSDGTPIREYFFVEDAVSAYLDLAQATEQKNIIGEAFNFSSGEKFSVIQIVQKIIDLMGAKVSPVIQNTARHEIQDQYLSIGKAKRILGWEPRYSTDEGLRLTIEWYRELMSR